MTTGYLLDTCVLSETSRVKPNPHVLRFIKGAPNLVIPAAAIVEFQQGIMQLCSRDPVKAVRLTTWYQGLIATGMPILETGKEVAEVWGIWLPIPDSAISSYLIQERKEFASDRTSISRQRRW